MADNLSNNSSRYSDVDLEEFKVIVEKKLEKVIPEQFKRHAHHWLILHGRYVCKARTPDCVACVV